MVRMVPAEARTTFGLKMSAQPGLSQMPLSPNPAAVRTSEPTLVGSWTESRYMASRDDRPEKLVAFQIGCLTMARAS